MTPQQETELAHELIDEVEEAIRTAHPECELLARNRVEDGEHPNTLLYGDEYYNLEEAIKATLRRKLHERRRKRL